jgi:oligopeptidase A
MDLFELCRQIFGITVKSANGDAPVWNPDVRYYNIFNESQKHIAGFYLDPYSRPKTNAAAPGWPTASRVQ